MTKTQQLERATLILELKQLAEKRGFKIGYRGHYERRKPSERTPGNFNWERWKFRSTSFRKETRTEFPDGTKSEWSPQMWGYYTELSVKTNPEGNVIIHGLHY